MRSTSTGRAVTPSAWNTLRGLVRSQSPHPLVIHTAVLCQVHRVLVSVAAARVDADTEGELGIWWLAGREEGELLGGVSVHAASSGVADQPG